MGAIIDAQKIVKDDQGHLCHGHTSKRTHPLQATCVSPPSPKTSFLDTHMQDFVWGPVSPAWSTVRHLGER